MTHFLWALGLSLAMLLLSIADYWRMKINWHGHRRLSDLIFGVTLAVTFALGYLCATHKAFL